MLARSTLLKRPAVSRAMRQARWWCGRLKVGIDFHALKFLQFAVAHQTLGDVATIGRLRLYVSKVHLGKILRLESAAQYTGFCEPLLYDHFKAQLGATYLTDMNHPIKHDRQYDTVLDYGTLEHIYNIPQAMKNLSSLCREGGQILHVSPANNHCGHGFYQLSPELFFSIYSRANGYADTKIFLADTDDQRHWYVVKEPSHGKRVTVASRCPLYVLVRTCRSGPFAHDQVQQSDYLHVWTAKPEARSSGLRQWVEGSERMYSAAFHLKRKLNRMGRLRFGKSS
ncbi:MAG: hypothetical protein K0Q60_4596, partial [Microvirga sp.]|nr:hypothetical protein [Microvirga sp.]